MTMLAELIEKVFHEYAQKCALQDKDQSYSYQWIQNEVNTLVGQFDQLKLTVEDRVVICLNSSAALIVSLLAVITKGMTFVLLDPNMPWIRQHFIIEDVQPKVIIKQKPCSKEKDSSQIKLELMLETSNKDSFGEINIFSNYSIMYITYTSGTTGFPKGVIVSYDSFLNHMDWMVKKFKFNHEIVVIQRSPIGFDAALWELFLPFLVGGTLVIPESSKNDIQILINTINKYAVSVIQFVPCFLAEFLNHTNVKSCETLKFVFCGGENISSNLPQLFYSKLNAKLYNLYGTTETTIDALCWLCDTSGNIYLGEPISNTKIYIVNEKFEPIRSEEIGELCVSGACLALGYLNRSELTREDFIFNPFQEKDISCSNNLFKLLYKTGDLIRLSPDGNLAYVGRKDRQVKLRGYRIELGEIEIALTKYIDVLQCAALLRSLGGNEVIVVYYVGKHSINTNILHAFLETILPQYMLPSFYLFIEKMPLTANGKIDYTALRNLPIKENYSRINSDLNYYQEIVRTIWSHVLGVYAEGSSQFFEIGGHSLAAIKVTRQVGELLGIEINVTDLFECPKLNNYADLVKKLHANGILERELPVIGHVPREGLLPLSFAQRRLWFVDRYEYMKSAYNVPLVYDVKGTLNIPRFETAVRKIIEQHEAFRTIFIEDEKGEPKQIVQSIFSFDLQQETYDGDNLAKRVDEIIHAPLDLEKGPLIKGYLLKSVNGKLTLIIVLHHIICDERTVQQFWSELKYIYDTKINEDINDGEKFHIIDYAVWERHFFALKLPASKKYWQDTLLNLDLDFNGLGYNTNHLFDPGGKNSSIIFDTQLVKKIKTSANRLGVTLHCFLLSLLNAFVAKYFCKKTICFLIPVSSREHEFSEKMFGFFLNLLPFVQKIDLNLKFDEHVLNTNKNFYELLANRFISFEEIKALWQLDNDTYYKVVDAFVSIQDKTVNEFQLGDVLLSQKSIPSRFAKFPISINFLIYKDYFEIDAEYRNLLDSFVIDEMLEQFHTFVNEVVEIDDKSLVDYSILSDTQKKKIIQRGRGEYIPLRICSVAEFLDTAFKTYYSHWALTISGKEYSYKEVYNFVGNALNQIYKKVDGDKCPALIVMNNSIESIVCCLALIRLGLVYTPVISNIPPGRLQAIIHELQPILIISDAEFKAKHKFSLSTETNRIKTLTYSEIFAFSDSHSQITVSKLDVSAIDKDLYIIYTSGSTGIPKGIIQTNRTILNLIEYMNLQVSKEITNVLQLSSLDFDVSIQEILFTLMTGRKLIVVPKTIRKNMHALSDFIIEEKIGLVFFTPSLLNEFTFYANRNKIIYQSLKMIISSGEQLFVNEDIKSFLERNTHIKLYNQYGPSETHVVTQSTVLGVYHKQTPVAPIGKPIINTHVFVVNENMDLLSSNRVGELCVAGAGLAKGYINDSNLNSKKFILNPFTWLCDYTTDESRLYKLLYKTGDLVKWLPDGNLVYVGRKDRQVKLRGYRIELEEIEAALAKHPDILQCTVLIKHLGSNEVIIAYYICTDLISINSQKLKAFLENYLPEYMLPSFYVLIEKLPITESGKIDYSILQGLPVIENESLVKRELNFYQEIVSMIWNDVLGVEVHENSQFFEIGGHSLAAIKIVRRVCQQLYVEVSVKDLFEYPKLDDFVHFIKGLHVNGEKQEGVPAIQRVSRERPLPLSSIQRRLWLIHQFEDNKSTYNVPLVFAVKGRLNVDQFELVVRTIIKQHEIFRTVFIEDVNGEPHQVAESAVSFDLQQENCIQENLTKRINEIIHTPFDLKKGPLLKGYLLNVHNGEVLLIIVLHHIVCDGRTIALLLSKIESLYLKRKESLLKPEIDFVDYVAYKESLLKTEHFLNKKQYWQNKIIDLTPIRLNINLLDRVPSEEKYGNQRYVLQEDIFLALKDTARINSVGLFTVLLSVFCIVGWRISGLERFGILTVIDESLTIADNELLGPLNNFLLIKFAANRSKTVRNHIDHIHNELISGLKNADYPLDEILSQENAKRNTDYFHTCLVYHYFNYYNKLQLGEHILIPQQVYCHSVKNPFSINFYQNEKSIELVIEYDKDQYDDLFVKAFANSYLLALSKVSLHLDNIINELSIINEHEHVKTTVEWNNTKSNYPNNKTLINLLLEQVNLKDKKIALKYMDSEISFAELWEMVKVIAGNLSPLIKNNRGIQNAYVAILLDKGPRAIAAMIAVISCGAAYFPIDRRAPDLKIENIFNDISFAAVITDSSNLKRLNKICLVLPSLNLDDRLIKHTNIRICDAIDKCAVILQTSGTSAKPNYVQVKNQSIVRLVKNTNYLSFKQRDVISQLSSYSFDVSLVEIWGALLNGLTVLIVPEEYIYDLAKIETYLRINKSTTLFTTSKLFNEYSHSRKSIFKGLRHIFVGGDKFDARALNNIKEDFLRDGVKIFNAYGQTEVTTLTTYYEIPLDKYFENPIPIGKPVSNVSVFVLDSCQLPLPIGIPGELYIAADGLSNGYLNNWKLTSDKFVRLSISDKKTGTSRVVTVFKSGDFVRWLEDGNLQFLGRNDRLVKVNDVRLELDEIESVARRANEVEECYADYYEPMQLSLYYKGAVTKNEVKNHIAKFLPTHLIPKTIIKIDYFPLNGHGKIDKGALRNKYKHQNTYVTNYMSDNKFIKNVTAAWIDILDHSNFDYNTSFFDAGGDSLKLIRLSVILKNKYYFTISTKDLFNLPTISDIVQYLQTNEVPFLAVNNFNMTSYDRRTNHDINCDIAIINMKVRSSDVTELSCFWNNIINGIELIYKNHFVTDRGVLFGLLTDYQYFQSERFGISELEAKLIDPQHKLLLEMAADLLSDAGYEQSKYSGKISVFAGCGFNYYMPSVIYKNFDLLTEHEKTIAIVGNEKDFLASRIAFKLGLNGPAININTACSSGLVAITKACDSLRLHESDMVIAGGISLIYPEAISVIPNGRGIYSFSNHCSPFSVNADGTLRGSGAGLVLLKRLEDAIRDNDDVISVIGGYNVNNDGSHKQSFYAPNCKAQIENIQSAIGLSNISIHDVIYIETHGTGTILGDTVEISALNNVFSDCKDNIYMGSIKANIGHTDAASGVLGLIKTALMTRYSIIPPQANFSDLNPQIKSDFNAFKIATSSYSLTESESKKYFGVSSFGVGGTNAHILLKKHLCQQKYNVNCEYFVFPLSASTSEKLLEYKNQLIDFVEKNKIKLIDELGFIANLGFTLQNGRKDELVRSIVIATNLDDLLVQLKSSNFTNLKSCSHKEFIESWLSGEKVNWDFLHHNCQHIRLHLPTIKYRKVKAWLESDSSELNDKHKLQNVSTTTISQECNLKESLIQIWKMIMGDIVINENDDFFDLGGDSLASLELCDKIMEKFGVEICLEDILLNRTLAEQFHFLDGRRKVLANNFIIKLNKQTKGIPLILVHPVGGGVFCYLPLAKYLEDKFQIYGIQNSVLTNSYKEFSNLSEMAKFYYEKICEIIKDDEIYLGGWSFGGNLAYEIANQFGSGKKKILKVVLFDSWNLSQLPRVQQSDLKQAIHAYEPEIIDLSAGYDMRHKNAFFDMIKNRMELVSVQNLLTFKIPVTLFKACELLPQFKSINGIDNHWSKLVCDAQLKIVSAKGNHDNLFNKEIFKELANQLAIELESISYV